MNLIKLQNDIHAQNVELGWWDEERPYEVFACLFHSELSEAMEGDRKGLMDDHLPQYEMFWVEIADFVIRVLDYLGSINNKFLSRNIDKFKSKHEFLLKMHSLTSESFPYGISVDETYLRHSVADSVAFASQHHVNLHKIILEKVAYNKTRADHKRENRAKVGGKKY